MHGLMLTFITSGSPLFPLALIAGIALLNQFLNNRSPNNITDERDEPNENGLRFWDHKRGHFYYYRGKHLDFTAQEIETVCLSHSPYFQLLSMPKREVFIQRLQAFIWSKEFYIVGFEGYKEMPILVSAAATQIMFGLPEYTLPHFVKVVIHPQEYMGYEPLRVLAGNVKGRAITLSWKHFFEDFKNPNDGHNVGLHELAHALQVQHLFQNTADSDQDFRADYRLFDQLDDTLLAAEKGKPNSLFSDYALSNTSEFWACSVELFFEKPFALQAAHPQLYTAISQLLNQDIAALMTQNGQQPS